MVVLAHQISVLFIRASCRDATQHIHTYCFSFLCFFLFIWAINQQFFFLLFVYLFVCLNQETGKLATAKWLKIVFLWTHKKNIFTIPYHLAPFLELLFKLSECWHWASFAHTHHPKDDIQTQKLTASPCLVVSNWPKFLRFLILPHYFNLIVLGTLTAWCAVTKDFPAVKKTLSSKVHQS